MKLKAVFTILKGFFIQENKTVFLKGESPTLRLVTAVKDCQNAGGVSSICRKTFIAKNPPNLSLHVFNEKRNLFMAIVKL